MSEASTNADADRIDKLLDAIDLLKENRREEARGLLRGLIHEKADFEEAWLWMSVAVDSIDQSVVCLDNVLRINRHNSYAIDALYRLRMGEIASKQKRDTLRYYRDVFGVVFWVLIMVLLFAVLFSEALY